MRPSCGRGSRIPPATCSGSTSSRRRRNLRPPGVPGGRRGEEVARTESDADAPPLHPGTGLLLVLLVHELHPELLRRFLEHEDAFLRVARAGVLLARRDVEGAAGSD